MKLLTETYQFLISCELSCYDRLILTGALPEISYGQGITSYLNSHEARIFDYAQFAEPFKALIRSNAEQLAKESGIEIEFIRKSHIRKESIISAKIAERGDALGLVHILSVMETCNTFKPWHDKSSGKTFLKPDQSKCLHYYFYFIDEYAGLCYVLVPTWCPFRLQVYVNGHNLLASELRQAGIPFTMIDNAFDNIEDAEKAQELSDEISVEKLHRRMEEFAWKFCPVYKELGLRYHWSIMQAEYATDIVFKKQAELAPIYSQLVATATHTIKPENIVKIMKVNVLAIIIFGFIFNINIIAQNKDTGNVNQVNKQGQKDGFWKEDLKFQITETYYHNGKKSGIFKGYSPKRILTCLGEYRNDTITGTWNYFDDDGRLIMIQKDFKRNDKLTPSEHHSQSIYPYQCYCITYYSNGNKESEGVLLWKEDPESYFTFEYGEWKYYDENGKLTRIKKFK